ncbi:MAG: hypothetical protein ACSHX8_06565 [Opitutaceae bacterium]
MQIFKSSLPLIVVLSMAVTSVATAATIVTITDYSFEAIDNSITSDSLAVLPTTTGNLGAWAVSLDNVAGLESTVSAGDDIAATDGTDILNISLGVGVVNSAVVTNTVTHSLLANHNYTALFDIGAASTAVGAIADINVRILASNDDVLGSADSSDLLTLIQSGSGLQQASIAFSTDATPVAGNIRIVLDASGLAGAQSSVAFDNFRLSAVPVPESSTFAMIAGLTAIAITSLRRRRS